MTKEMIDQRIADAGGEGEQVQHDSDSSGDEEIGALPQHGVGGPDLHAADKSRGGKLRSTKSQYGFSSAASVCSRRIQRKSAASGTPSKTGRAPASAEDVTPQKAGLSDNSGQRVSGGKSTVAARDSHWHDASGSEQEDPELAGLSKDMRYKYVSVNITKILSGSKLGREIRNLRDYRDKLLETPKRFVGEIALCNARLELASVAEKLTATNIPSYQDMDKLMEDVKKLIEKDVDLPSTTKLALVRRTCTLKLDKMLGGRKMTTSVFSKTSFPISGLARTHRFRQARSNRCALPWSGVKVRPSTAPWSSTSWSSKNCSRRSRRYLPSNRRLCAESCSRQRTMFSARWWSLPTRILMRAS